MTDITLRPETPDDHPAIDDIIERAFGPGRYAKSSERLREGNTPLAGMFRPARAAPHLSQLANRPISLAGLFAAGSSDGNGRINQRGVGIVSIRPSG